LPSVLRVNRDALRQRLEYSASTFSLSLGKKRQEHGVLKGSVSDSDRVTYYII